MKSLQVNLPSLVSELSVALHSASHYDLASQIERAEIRKVTFDEEVCASYVYLTTPPSSKTSALENSNLQPHGTTIEVETRYWTLLDVDAFGRIWGLEILSPLDLEQDLRLMASTTTP